MELLRWDEIAKRLKLGSKRAFLRWLDEHPDFPEPFDIGAKQPMRRWMATEVEIWLWKKRCQSVAKRGEAPRTKKRPLQSEDQ